MGDLLCNNSRFGSNSKIRWSFWFLSEPRPNSVFEKGSALFLLHTTRALVLSCGTTRGGRAVGQPESVHPWRILDASMGLLVAKVLGIKVNLEGPSLWVYVGDVWGCVRFFLLP